MHSLKNEKTAVYLITLALSIYILVVNILRYINEDLRA
jgi:hypothetical protein